MSKKVLLCIDDDYNGLMIRRLFLESQGYQVLIARDVTEGLRLFDRERVDAVVLDYQMPQITGDTVAAAMKQRRPDIPIVMLSAFITLPDEATRNADAYVVKGNAPKKLLGTLDHLLKKKAA